MVAAGFNGNPKIAQAFFEEYFAAQDRLLDKVASQLTANMPPPPPEVSEADAYVTNPDPEPAEETAPDPDAPLTEAEILTIASVEDVTEDVPEPAPEPGPATFSSRGARAYARKARRLKLKRAGTSNAVPDTKEDSHGSSKEE